jgi:hypothetical protein
MHLKSSMQIEDEQTYKSSSEQFTVCKSNITNMATVLKFEVIFDKFKVTDIICI